MIVMGVEESVPIQEKDNASSSLGYKFSSWIRIILLSLRIEMTKLVKNV